MLNSSTSSHHSWLVLDIKEMDIVIKDVVIKDIDIVLDIKETTPLRVSGLSMIYWWLTVSIFRLHTVSF